MKTQKGSTGEVFRTQVHPYTIVRTKRKTLGLYIDQEGRLIVRAPKWVRKSRIEAIIAEREGWIRQAQEQVRAKQRQRKPKEFVEGEGFWYLGMIYPLAIVERPPALPSRDEGSGGLGLPMGGVRIEVVNEQGEESDLTMGIAGCGSNQFSNMDFRFTYEEPQPKRQVSSKAALLQLTDRFYLAREALPEARQVFEAWYRDQAQKVISQRVLWYAAYYGFEYKRVRITSARTRWGSCSSNGALNFPFRLVMAPMEVVDYVVVHELVHTQVQGHGKEFWAKVGEILPDYKEVKKWLKEEGEELVL